MSWEIAISGDENDLRALAHALRDTDYLIHEKDGLFILTGPVFSNLRDADSLREQTPSPMKPISPKCRNGLGMRTFQRRASMITEKPDLRTPRLFGAGTKDISDFRRSPLKKSYFRPHLLPKLQLAFII